MDDFMRSLVKIAVEEHKGDADGVAGALGDRGFKAIWKAMREHATKLRKERGA